MSQVKAVKRLRSITSILASGSSVRRVDQRDVPQLEAEPLFTEAAIERQFDRAAWLRDGYVVLDGIMTERARHDWAAALHRVLAANDEFIMSDWDLVNVEPALTGYWYNSEQVMQPLLLQLPATQPSLAEKRGWLGSCKQIKPADTANAQRVEAMRHQGVIPEYFAAGHDPWLLSVITHPQMVALQQLLLNSKEVRFQHNNLLTRSQGNPGSKWHCHRLHQPTEDDAGPTRSPPSLGVVLNLCYPDGFGAGDGGLKIIPGSHLYRNGSQMEGSQDDESLRGGWLRGKRHPITGEPLAIKELSVGPGTIVSILSHGAHAVTPKTNPGTRLGTIFGFRKPDPERKIVTGMTELPSNWQQKRDDGELPLDLTQMLQLF